MLTLAFDLAYLLLAIAVLGPPAAGLAWLLAQMPLPAWALAALLPAWGVLFLVGAIAMAGLVRLTLPRLVPGRYPFPGHPQSTAWLLHFALMRLLAYPPFAQPIWSFAVLRWAMLNALGAKAPFTMRSASDVKVVDASLLALGPGCMLAAGTWIAGHLIEGDELILAPVAIGPGAQLHGDVAIAPGCTIGANATIGIGSKLLPRVVIGEDVYVGLACLFYPDVRVGANAVIGHQVIFEAEVVVGEDAVVAAGCRVPKGTVIGDGERYPAREKALPREITP